MNPQSSERNPFMLITSNIILSGVNGDAGDLKEGQEVYISASGTVRARLTADAAKRPIGIVVTGAKTGEKVSVATYAIARTKFIIKGGAIAVGEHIIPNGTVTNGLPEYTKTTTATHFVTAVVWEAGAENAVCEALIMPVPFVIPAP